MKKILLVSFLLLNNLVFGQITISHPLNNAVYQRNTASQANLIISGSYTQPILTSIQARLINADNSVVVAGFDWTIITQNPTMGFFRGELSNVPAGWYIVEVRGLKSGIVVESTVTLNRVGIGDVFMIAGQSNAQGYTNNGGVGLPSTSSKVVTHNNLMYCSDLPIPYPNSLDVINATTRLGTAGRDAWCYSKLGTNIVGTTGFPVAFFNSGASGASSENWAVSSNGGLTNHPFLTNPSFPQQFCAEENNPAFPNGTPGMPYLNFRRGLNMYNSMFGARAVLWHQGETDKYYNVSSATYSANMNTLISNSRTHFNANLPWVIARASFEPTVTPFNSINITNAQTSIPGTLSSVYLGPDTDIINNNTIPSSRDALNLHFSLPLGLTELANAWSNYLDAGFFTSSTPIIANTPPIITSTILTTTSLSMNVPGGYTAYKWIRTDLAGNSNFGNASEGTSTSLTKSSGTYRCWVTSANGNQQISSEVNVNKALLLGINSSCSANNYVSDLKYFESNNNFGPIEIDKTLGQIADGDGVPIVLKGISYAKGIGMSVNSEVSYQITSGQYYKLTSKIGIGDEVSGCTNTGGVVFKVFGDNTLLYTSPTVYRNSAVINLDLNIYNYSKIKLRVEEVASSSFCNKAIWADTQVLCVASDITPPTVPANLVVVDTLEKCLTFQWNASTDNLAILGYEIFKNNILIGTLPASSTSYTLSGLTALETVNFAVKAKDIANNLSSPVSVIITSIQIDWDYVNEDLVCTGRTYLPSFKKPNNGVFSFVSGPPATINATTGAFFTNSVYNPPAVGAHLLRYTIAQGNATCESFGDKSFAAITPPANTPIITSDKKIINIGNIINLNATSCGANTLVWNFNPSNSQIIADSPVVNKTYLASCQINGCFNYSNSIAVKVIPNCASNYNFVSPTDNLGSNVNSLIFNSSNTIQAVNAIVPANNVIFNAANAILLNPGFSVGSGVNFTAKIANCPN